jgi:serine/threonine protein kinase
VAVKVYDKKKLNSEEKREFTQNEVNVMLKIGAHKNIARLWRVIEDSKNVFLIQEVAGKKALSDVIRAGNNKRLSEDDARPFFRQLTSAVSYVHALGICHRDLKMTNILISEKKNLKLIDFGFSTLNRANFRTYCGTPSYMAPELVKKMEYDGIQVDIWAIGVILYKMVTGDYPFGSEKNRYLNQRILACDVKMPAHVGNDCRNLIGICLQYDPGNRPSIAEIEGHKWCQVDASAQGGVWGKN